MFASSAGLNFSVCRWGERGERRSWCEDYVGESERRGISIKTIALPGNGGEEDGAVGADIEGELVEPAADTLEWQQQQKLQA